MAGIPHHLIDIRGMTRAYSAADFQQMGREAIETIQQQGKLADRCREQGYTSKRFGRLSFRGEGDLTIRQRYEQEAVVIGKEAWQKLQAVDPLAAAKIHYNNERK